MELLPNQRSRKKMYRYRKKNIFKKAEELAILCGIDVCVVMFRPANKKTSTSQPATAAETWPQDRILVNRIIRKYKAMLPASTISPSSSTAPLAIEDTTSTPSSSSSFPFRNVLEKRNNINLDLSLSLPGSYDSKMGSLDKVKCKKIKLHADEDENINSQEG
ncbi:hypothetical protein M0R45_036793 [Rubus argutus]|uniref:MADS-box domain-containing protein n=1 Tax=Rubus argutus TaxID=59490 RepID=A0AAW1VY84_RUBAR